MVYGISEIYRDSDILRHRREQARLKFLFLEFGWTPERSLPSILDEIASHALEHPEWLALCGAA